MKKNLKRLLSLVLATTLLLLPSVRSVSAQADDITTTRTTEVMQDDSAVQTEAANPGITEVVSRREENVKHFDMGDGTYQAVAYARPIHELDSDGNWQNIETGLQLSSTGSAARYTADQMGVTFAQRIGTTQPLMALNEAGNSISLNFVPSQTSLTRSSFASILATVENAPIKAEQTHFDTFEEATNIDLSSSITYSEVQPNTDIEYVVEPGLVKENIIVKDSRNSYIYDFSLNLTGLYPAMLNDGSILIYDSDTDEMCYAIPAPYMYDALGNLSEDVWYTLSGANGSYTLTVEASAAWINDSNRTFPVMIDPTVVTGPTTGQDTFIDVARPTEIFGLRQSLWVRMNNTMITYIEPDTFTLPSNSEFISAILQCHYYYYDYVTTGSVTAGAYKVESAWDETVFNWNSSSTSVNNGIATTQLDTDIAYGGQVINNPGFLRFDITDAAEMWIENPSSNNGIAIKHESGDNWSFAIRSYQSGGYIPVIIYKYFQITPVLIGIPDTSGEDQDHISGLLNVASILLNNLEVRAIIHEDYLEDEGAFFDFIDSTENTVLVIEGHGYYFGTAEDPDGSYIVLDRDRVNEDGEVILGKCLWSNQINNNRFANTRLVIFLACYSAEGGENAFNLASKAFGAGATTAIGFEGEIECEAANIWIEQLFIHLVDGKTVEEACELATEQGPYYDDIGLVGTGVENYVICGSKTMKIVNPYGD